MAGIGALAVAYVLSQFFRSFLAVIAPELSADVGATSADLGTVSGAWFLSFAAMQIPVGLALDRIGPRRTASVVFALGAGGGAALFAAAQVTEAVQFFDGKLYGIDELCSGAWGG